MSGLNPDFFPSRKTSGPVQLIKPTGLPPAGSCSDKNIRIKYDKAKRSGRKTFIFLRLAVNQLSLARWKIPFFME